MSDTEWARNAAKTLQSYEAEHRGWKPLTEMLNYEGEMFYPEKDMRHAVDIIGEQERALIVATSRIEARDHIIAQKDHELQRVTEDLVAATERIEELEREVERWKAAFTLTANRLADRIEQDDQRKHGFLQD